LLPSRQVPCNSICAPPPPLSSCLFSLSPQSTLTNFLHFFY
jgi:hypothetical protein